MSPVSRGFRHLHRAPAGEEGRVPPGQYLTDEFPVLSVGPTPRTPLEAWTFSVTEGGQTRKSWTWQESRALPAGVDLSGLASLSQPGSALIPAGGIRDRPACRTSTQIRNREGTSMSHEQSMSMSDEPQEEPMSMGQPDQDSMSTGQPDQDSKSTGQPHEDSM